MTDLSKVAMLVALTELTEIFQRLDHADVPTEGRLHYRAAQWLIGVAESYLERGLLERARSCLIEIREHLEHLVPND